MAEIYLNPSSSQEQNRYMTGGTETEHTNRIVNALEPYLTQAGIVFARSTPDMTPLEAIEEANENSAYDLFLALRSGAAPDQFAGMLRGPSVYYNPAVPRSRQAAELTADELRLIYPEPQLVEARPTLDVTEVVRPNAPAILVDVGYRDNMNDAVWIAENTEAIARALASAIGFFLNVPMELLEPDRLSFANEEAASMEETTSSEETASMEEIITSEKVVAMEETVTSEEVVAMEETVTSEEVVDMEETHTSEEAASLEETASSEEITFDGSEEAAELEEAEQNAESFDLSQSSENAEMEAETAAPMQDALEQVQGFIRMPAFVIPVDADVSQFAGTGDVSPR